MQETGLKGVALELYNGLPPELQAEYWQLQDNKEKARELADMVGSVVVDEALPVEIIGMVADCLKEDLLQIKQAAVDIMEEQQAIEAIRQQAAGKEG